MKNMIITLVGDKNAIFTPKIVKNHGKFIGKFTGPKYAHLRGTAIIYPFLFTASIGEIHFLLEKAAMYICR
jgi:hypothetical protein